MGGARGGGCGGRIAHCQSESVCRVDGEDFVGEPGGLFGVACAVLDFGEFEQGGEVERGAVGVEVEGLGDVGFGEGVVVLFCVEGAEVVVEEGAFVGAGGFGVEGLGVGGEGVVGAVGEDVGVGEVGVADGLVGLEAGDGDEVVEGGGSIGGVLAGAGEVEVSELGVGEPGVGVVGEGVGPDGFGGLVDAGEGEAVGGEEEDERDAGAGDEVAGRAAGQMEEGGDDQGEEDGGGVVLPVVGDEAVAHEEDVEEAEHGEEEEGVGGEGDEGGADAPEEEEEQQE